MKIALIACSKSKAQQYLPASEFYTGQLFQKSYEYATKVLKANSVFILSARYYVVKPGQYLEMYEETLVGKSVGWRRWWADQVLADLKMYGLLDGCHTWHLLAGKNYIEFIEDSLSGEVHTPLVGLGIGEQQAWLKKQING